MGIDGVIFEKTLGFVGFYPIFAEYFEG